MAETMTKKERVAAAVKGKEVDRPPISFWRHFFEKETSAEGLAEAMLGFQKTFDWDFMKVNPRAGYHAEDWGCRFTFSGQPHAGPQLLESAVKTTDDWKKLEVLRPDRGVLGEQLQSLKLIKEGLRGEIFFVETIFTPLSIAGRLIGDDEKVAKELKEHPKEIHHALDVITETYVNFAKACLDVGASGIFFATTGFATYERLTDAEYEEFGRPYDLKVLKAVEGAELNILHVCRNQNMLKKLTDYPVHAINWATYSPTNPSLREIQGSCEKALIGGINHEVTLKDGTPQQVVAELREALAQTGGHRWMLGPGCSISTQTPETNLRAVREAIEKL